MKRYVFLCQDGSIQDVGLLDADRLSITTHPLEDEPGIHKLEVRVISTLAQTYPGLGAGFTIAKGEVHNLEGLQAGIFALIDKERHTLHVSVNIPELARSPFPGAQQLQLKGM